jgi:ligand-binding sensor domain-containing protein
MGGAPLLAQRATVVEFGGTFDIPLTQISIEQGLSQGMINELVEDHLGYLWVGTKDGLKPF